MEAVACLAYAGCAAAAADVPQTSGGRVSFAGTDSITSVDEYYLSADERQDKLSAWQGTWKTTELFEWAEQALAAAGYSDEEIDFAMVKTGCGSLAEATRVLDGERAHVGKSPPPRGRTRPSAATLGYNVRKLNTALELQSVISESDEADEALAQERMLCALRITQPSWRVDKKPLLNALREARNGPERCPAVMSMLWGRVSSRGSLAWLTQWLPAIAVAALPAAAVAMALDGSS
jgi:hypothetical protein